MQEDFITQVLCEIDKDQILLNQEGDNLDD